ncbi:MAG: DUF4105 domain-containing protein [Deferribacteraceae bacterium]|nr:DUF4105 domain-containing protein [Deferribacteraceae bacterium]
MCLEPVTSAMLEAESIGLANDPYWETLLHYEKGWFSGYRSLIDDPGFFLSPRGKTDKKAELNATIEGILNPDAGLDDKHPQCRFPARTEWLKENIPALKNSLPDVICPHFDNISEKIAPKHVSIIFPYYNMSDPASIFGHTMLRLEPGNRSPLLGYSVTYSANNGNSGPVMLVIGGLTGYFPGLYTVAPYFEKLNEYTAIEKRDVWEYELDFTEDEVRRMYLHIWEMAPVYSGYYFFDENCAYSLLFLLEAARPGIKFTGGYTWVIPSDTIRAVANSGLVSQINYRPSKIKKMETIADSLSVQGVLMAKDVADGEMPPDSVLKSELSDRQKIAVFDLASELVRYNFQGAAPKETEIYKARSLEILLARSQYTDKNDYTVKRPEVSPDKGHLSSRLMAGAGYGGGNTYLRTGLRTVYHSLIDNTEGYLEGSGITAGEINLRWYPDSNKTNIEKLALFDLISLTPVTKLFASPSWRFAGGIYDRSILPDRTLITGYLSGGGGIAIPAYDNMLVWGMAMGQLQGAERYKSWLTAGFGVNGGIIYPTGNFGKFLTEVNYMRYTEKGGHYEGDLNIQYAVYPSVNRAFIAGAKWMQENAYFKNEISLTYMLHF